MLSLDDTFRSYKTTSFPFINGHSVIAPFWSDIDTRASPDSNLTNGSAVYYHVYSDKQSDAKSNIMLDTITRDVRKYSREVVEDDVFREFNATWAIVTTWFQVSPYDGYIYQDIEVLNLLFCLNSLLCTEITVVLSFCSWLHSKL